ncbi:hypothetical protein ALP54_03774 [Pseudomonas amygdali pv. lachrymans]|nr:hypothetical protein ALP54_03774 [Pseudomonas amygdali pv. lachrymans]
MCSQQTTKQIFCIFLEELPSKLDQLFKIDEAIHKYQETMCHLALIPTHPEKDDLMRDLKAEILKCQQLRDETRLVLNLMIEEAGKIAKS